MSIGPESIEVREKVEAYERALGRNLGEQLEHVARVESKFGAAGQKKLGLAAWPLRPLFLDLTFLKQISKQISNLLEIYRDSLLSRLGDLDGLASQLRLPTDVLAALHLGDALKDPDLLSAARPDGFLYQSRYVVSEFNVGGGLFATLSYTEVLHELLFEGPVADSLNWVTSGSQRPFRTYLRLLKERMGPVDDPTIAMMLPSEEKAQLHDWELDLFVRLWQAQGMRALFLDEQDLAHDARGVLRERTQDRPIHAVVALSTGECYLPQPERLSHITSKLGRQSRAHAFFHPLACLCFGKGCLPSLSKSAPPFRNRENPSVELASSHWPDPDRASEYRLEKSNWVMKRAWSGKNTFVGHSSHGRVWNRALQKALDESGSILQAYSPLPTVLLPCLIDRKIVKLPVRFELSPFLIGSEYAGAMVRYAPDADGVILSPSPADLGITIVGAGPF